MRWTPWPASRPNGRLVALLLSLVAGPALAQDAGGPDQPKGKEGAHPLMQAAFDERAASAGEGGRVLRVSVADVGRFALRNSPRFRSATLDPTIARTFEAEAWAEFDTLFVANASYGRDRNPVFFNPAAFGPGGTSDAELERNIVNGGTGLEGTNTLGGQWSLGYDASSTEQRGAVSISSLQPRYNGGLSLGYAHPLLRGSGEDVTLSFTRETAEDVVGSDAELRRNAEETVAQAETAYWLLVGAIADLVVRRKSLDVAEELLDISEARLRSGRGIRVEVTEALAGVESRKVDVIAAETFVENQADRLRELTIPFTSERRDGKLDLDIVIVPSEIPGEDLSNLPVVPDHKSLTDAIARRPDVASAQAAVAAAEIAEFRAEDGTRPQLDAVTGGSLRGQGSGFGDSADVIGDRRTYAWEVGVAFSIPLGNELALARFRRARTQTLRAARVLSALENEAVRDIRQANRNVRSSADRIRASQRSREASEAQLAAERSRQENGIVTPFEVLQVEEDLTEARVVEIRSRVEFEVARVSLELSRGTLLESRGLLGLVERDE